MADVELRVDGAAYPGWTKVEIRRSLDEIADSFGVTLVSPLSSIGGVPNLDEWSAVELVVDGEVLIDGYVTGVSDGYNADAVWVSVSGAAKAIDLVHCSVSATKRWKNRDIADIVSDLAQPFGIDVVSDEITPMVERFATKSGETAFEAIDRLIREYGMRAVSLGDSIGLTRTGSRISTAALVTGRTILEGGRERSSEERFSRYIFKGQVAGSADAYGAAAANPKGEVTDDAVPRFRPLLVKTDAGRGSAGLKARAAWERNTRAGKAERLTYKVHAGPGDLSTCWHAGAGGVWAPNTLVAVRDDFLGVDAQLLVVDVTLTLDATEGHACSLSLAHPDAYIPERPPKKKKKGSTFSW